MYTDYKFRNTVPLSVIKRLFLLGSHCRTIQWNGGAGLRVLMDRLLRREEGEGQEDYELRFLGMDTWDNISLRHRYRAWLFCELPKQFARTDQRSKEALFYRIFWLLSEYDLPTCWTGQWGPLGTPTNRWQFYLQAYPMFAVRTSALGYSMMFRGDAD